MLKLKIAITLDGKAIMSSVYLKTHSYILMNVVKFINRSGTVLTFVKKI